MSRVLPVGDRACLLHPLTGSVAGIRYKGKREHLKEKDYELHE